MTDAVIVTVAVEILKYGTPLMLFSLLVTLVIWQWMKASLKNAERKSDKDRAEHMAKWDSLIRQQREIVNQLTQIHRSEMDRQFRLYERMAEVLELHAGQLTKIAAQIDATFPGKGGL